MSNLLIAAICLGLLSALVVSLARNRRRRDHPVTRIADCRDGARVKIVGRVVALDTLVAPGTGRACVGYTFEAASCLRHAATHALTSFLVDDGSARAVVTCRRDDALALDPDVHELRTFELFKPDDIPALRGLGLARARSLREAVLMPGERVAVFGEVQLIAEPGSTADSGYRDGSIARVQIVRPERGALFVTGRPYHLGAERG